VTYKAPVPAISRSSILNMQAVGWSLSVSPSVYCCPSLRIFTEPSASVISVFLGELITCIAEL
jgi:hypothetical protein